MSARFANSRRLVWVTLWASFALQLLAVVVMREHAAPVLAASIPTMLMLVAAWSGITNWAEVRQPKLE